jgi:hypothetical protein
VIKFKSSSFVVNKQMKKAKNSIPKISKFQERLEQMEKQRNNKNI